VGGKGLPAVQLASVMLGCSREAAFAEPDLPSVAALSSRVADQLGEEDFITAVPAEFDPHERLRLVSCGASAAAASWKAVQRSREPGGRRASAAAPASASLHLSAT
jgi:hypothetical protein